MVEFVDDVAFDAIEGHTVAVELTGNLDWAVVDST